MIGWILFAAFVGFTLGVITLGMLVSSAKPMPPRAPMRVLEREDTPYPNSGEAAQRATRMATTTSDPRSLADAEPPMKGGMCPKHEGMWCKAWYGGCPNHCIEKGEVG
jgi:hypothetical protein